MNLSFDYYHNLEDTELYLCNPDGRELFPIVGTERKLTLRFNDLSEFSFICYSTTTSSEGEIVELESYEYIQTRRIVFVTKVGWFVIKNVNEHDNGVVKYKEVSCESLQAIFKDRGFYCEERVYYFYNPSDPLDAQYKPEDESSIPSVMGQLYQQLGIKQALSQGLADPPAPYDDWTITYVNNTLTGKGRNFKESTSFGYEWMVKDVEEAFEAIVLFDFYYKTIHVMLPSEVTEKANVIYTFSNFMKDVEIDEDAEDIVTVMKCKGENCDISVVNPTGTDYICDFSYYMDDAGKWMSAGLKQALAAWSAAVESRKSDYQTIVLHLRNAYDSLAQMTDALQTVSQIYTDLSAAVAKRSVAITENPASTLYGTVWAETVEIGEKSLDPTSSVYSTALINTKIITAYRDIPSFNESTRKWSCSGPSHTGTLDDCFAYVDSSNKQYLYFMDSSNNTSYCKLVGKANINSQTYATEYICKGFSRYIDLNIANVWMNRYDVKRSSMNAAKADCERDIKEYEMALKGISDQIEIKKFMGNRTGGAALLKELYCYWIEGEYTNENISVLEDTTQAEAMDLANELLDAGELELSKVCQPKLQFSLSSVDCTKQYEFRDQMSELELGKIITVERQEGIWYYPALLEIEFDLDRSDEFALKFANALRLDDWGYTFGDLMSEASSTSRQVSANWQNILQYEKDRPTLLPLIQEPLSSTLRAAFSNMTNQEFTIDDTGILGRRFTDDSTKDSFENEQIRIINNVILFTDDNWETIKTALGKIYYTDPISGQLVSEYGLIGETIIGSLVMGETLKIINSNNTVLIDGSGITIKNGNAVVFNASTNGTLTISGYAKTSDLANKNKTYRQSSEPTGSQLTAGDLWFDTGHNNCPYVYNGTSWIKSDDTKWASSNDTTKIDGGKIYTGSIYASALNASSIITDLLTVKDNSNHTLFKADASSKSVEIAGFTVENGKIYSNGHSSLDDTSYAGVYIGNDGISILSNGGTRSMKLNINTGSFNFKGSINATSGNFANGCTFGTNSSSYYPFTVGAVTTFSGSKSPVLYSRGGSFPGMGGLGIIQDNYVYIGGDGFSYWDGSEPKQGIVRDYLTATRPGIIFCNGNTTAHADEFCATQLWMNGLKFYYYAGGSLRTCTASELASHQVLELEIQDNGVRVNGNLFGNSSGSVQSDRSRKNSIEPIGNAYDVMFDALTPVTYKYNDGTSGRKHTGFIAQDVYSAIQSAGLSSTDLAAYIEWSENGSIVRGLRYEEFVAINTWQIQKLKQRVAALEARIQALSGA